MNQKVEVFNKRMDQIHAVWHSFRDEFLEKRAGDWVFNLGGVALMEMVEEWAKDYPDDVHVVAVDDDLFASSLLVLIEHKNDQEYWGTSFVFIPQLIGAPARFFMYPMSIKDLLAVVTKIDKKKDDLS